VTRITAFSYAEVGVQLYRDVPSSWSKLEGCSELPRCDVLYGGVPRCMAKCDRGGGVKIGQEWRDALYGQPLRWICKYRDTQLRPMIWHVVIESFNLYDSRNSTARRKLSATHALSRCRELEEDHRLEW